MKYRVYGTVTGCKYLGTYEANSEDAAIDMAVGNAYVSLCHQCSNHIDDPEITEIQAELVED